MELKTCTVMTKNGNRISPAFSKEMKSQLYSKLVNVLGGELNARGCVSVPVCLNEKGETVYAKVEVTATMETPDYKPEPKLKEKKESEEKKVEVEIPNLFD